MARPHGRCDACRAALPTNAVRCPSCGHVQGDVVPVEIGTRSGGPGAPRRGRRDLVLLAALGALVVGGLALVGRDSQPSPSAAGSTTTSSTTTSTSSTSTTRPTTTTSTTLPPLQLGEPTGIRLLVSNGNDVTLLDLDTGERTPAAGLSGGYFVPRRGGVVIVGTVSQALFVADPHESSSISLGPASLVLAAAEEDRVWLVNYDPAGQAVMVREADTTGAVLAGPFAVGAAANIVGAVRDGVIASEHGSIYLLRADGSAHRLGTGDPLGAGGDSVLAVTCDDRLQCGAVVIDARSGRSLPVTGLEHADESGFQAQISPDGRTAALYDLVGGEQVLRLIDLASGQVTNVTTAITNGRQPAGPAGLTFSADSRWLFGSTGGALFANRIGTDTTIPLDVGSPHIDSVTAI